MGKFLVLLDDGHPLNEILERAQTRNIPPVPAIAEVRLLGMLGEMTSLAQAMPEREKLRPALINLAAEALAWLEALDGKRSELSPLIDTP